MNATKYQGIVRAGGMWDLFLTAGFAIPGVSGIILEHLHSLHIQIGEAGAFPSFEPMHMLFVNLFGSIVTVWSVIRIHRPEPIKGLYDTAGRLIFATLMIGYFLTGGTAVLLIFAGLEIVWAVVQGTGWLSTRGTPSTRGAGRV